MSIQGFEPFSKRLDDGFAVQTAPHAPQSTLGFVKVTTNEQDSVIDGEKGLVAHVMQDRLRKTVAVPIEKIPDRYKAIINDTVLRDDPSRKNALDTGGRYRVIAQACDICSSHVVDPPPSYTAAHVRERIPRTASGRLTVNTLNFGTSVFGGQISRVTSNGLQQADDDRRYALEGNEGACADSNLNINDTLASVDTIGSVEHSTARNGANWPVRYTLAPSAMDGHLVGQQTITQFTDRQKVTSSLRPCTPIIPKHLQTHNILLTSQELKLRTEACGSLKAQRFETPVLHKDTANEGAKCHALCNRSITERCTPSAHQLTTPRRQHGMHTDLLSEGFDSGIAKSGSMQSHHRIASAPMPSPATCSAPLSGSPRKVSSSAKEVTFSLESIYAEVAANSAVDSGPARLQENIPDVSDSCVRRRIQLTPVTAAELAEIKRINELYAYEQSGCYNHIDNTAAQADRLEYFNSDEFLGSDGDFQNNHPAHRTSSWNRRRFTRREGMEHRFLYNGASEKDANQGLHDTTIISPYGNKYTIKIEKTGEIAKEYRDRHMTSCTTAITRRQADMPLTRVDTSLIKKRTMQLKRHVDNDIDELSMILVNIQSPKRRRIQSASAALRAYDRLHSLCPPTSECDICDDTRAGNAAAHLFTVVRPDLPIPITVEKVSSSLEKPNAGTLMTKCIRPYNGPREGSFFAEEKSYSGLINVVAATSLNSDLRLTPRKMTIGDAHPRDNHECNKCSTPRQSMHSYEEDHYSSIIYPSVEHMKNQCHCPKNSAAANSFVARGIFPDGYTPVNNVPFLQEPPPNVFPYNNSLCSDTCQSCNSEEAIPVDRVVFSVACPTASNTVQLYLDEKALSGSTASHITGNAESYDTGTSRNCVTIIQPSLHNSHILEDPGVLLSQGAVHLSQHSSLDLSGCDSDTVLTQSKSTIAQDDEKSVILDAHCRGQQRQPEQIRVSYKNRGLLEQGKMLCADGEMPKTTDYTIPDSCILHIARNRVSSGMKKTPSLAETTHNFKLPTQSKVQHTALRYKYAANDSLEASLLSVQGQCIKQ